MSIELKYWTRLGLDASDHKFNPHITLYEEKSGTMAEVFGDSGEIVFYPEKVDCGYSKGHQCYEWGKLLEEAQSVIDEYFPRFDEQPEKETEIDNEPIEFFKGLK